MADARPLSHNWVAGKLWQTFAAFAMCALHHCCGQKVLHSSVQIEAHSLIVLTPLKQADAVALTPACRGSLVPAGQSSKRIVSHTARTEQPSMAATISNVHPVDVAPPVDKQMQDPAEHETDSLEQPKLLSMLQHLPTCGHWAPETAVCVAKSVAPYVCTHEGAAPPAGQVIATDNSTEAWIRLLRKRGAAGTGPGSEAGKSTAKRVLQTPASETAAQKKQRTAAQEKTPAPTPTAKQLDKELQEASKPEAGTSKQGRKPLATSANGASTSKAAQQGGSKAKDGQQGNGHGQEAEDTKAEGAAHKSPYFNAPPAAAAALSAAVTNQTASKTAYDQEQLKKMPVKELKEVCKARSLQVSGTKDQLITRIVEYQRRVKHAQRSS